ncbi:unnamed protein product, partial [Leptidea sinapis]
RPAYFPYIIGYCRAKSYEWLSAIISGNARGERYLTHPARERQRRKTLLTWRPCQCEWIDVFHVENSSLQQTHRSQVLMSPSPITHYGRKY